MLKWVALLNGNDTGTSINSLPDPFSKLLLSKIISSVSSVTYGCAPFNYINVFLMSLQIVFEPTARDMCVWSPNFVKYNEDVMYHNLIDGCRCYQIFLK